MLDFTHLEQYRENNRIEAKKALGGLPKSIWETYSAFANTMGGVILLGVEEHKDRTLHPVNLPDPERLVREFWDKVNNPTITNINILTPKNIQIRTINGNDIIVITVPRATRQEKPVFINKSPLNGSYRRNGEGDYKCTREEVLSMQRDALIMTPDMKLLPHMELDVFHYESIHRYRNRLKSYSPGHPWEGLADHDFLCELDAVELDAEGRMRPTAAGLLMFGLEPVIKQEFPNYRLDFQWTEEHFSSDSDNLSDNLCDFYFRVCDCFARYLTALPANDRQRMTPFIHEALREALANCLINADYYGNCGIQITLQDDCCTFVNPGAFRVDVEAAKCGGISDPRNAALVKMFNLLDIGDSSGNGLSQIYAIWQKMGWNYPEIRELYAPESTEHILKMCKSSDHTSSIQHTDTAPSTSQSNRRLIINYLTDHACAGTEELTDFMGLDPQIAQVLFDDLILTGIIEIKDAPDRTIYRLKA